MRRTVHSVYNIDQIQTKWDNGQVLALTPVGDSFRRLTQKEIDQKGQKGQKGQTIKKQSM